MKEHIQYHLLDLPPFYKKEAKYLKENYRPESILQKERLMFHKINAYFETILSNVQ